MKARFEPNFIKCHAEETELVTRVLVALKESSSRETRLILHLCGEVVRRAEAVNDEPKPSPLPPVAFNLERATKDVRDRSGEDAT